MCVYEHKWLSLEYKASDLYHIWWGGEVDFHKEYTVFLKENKATTACYFTNRTIKKKPF